MSNRCLAFLSPYSIHSYIYCYSANWLWVLFFLIWSECSPRASSTGALVRSVCRETQIVPTAGLFYGVRVVLGALLLFVAKLSHLCTVLLSIGPASCIGPRLYLACAIISAYQSKLVVVHDRGLPTGIPCGVCSEQTLPYLASSLALDSCAPTPHRLFWWLV